VRLRRNARRVAIAVASIVLGGLAATVAGASGATTQARGSLTITTLGLPAGQQPAILLSGGGGRRRITLVRARLRVPAGQYVVSVRPVVVHRATRNVHGGATVYPARRQLVLSVRAGHHTSVAVRYAGVVNPGVRAVPPVVAVIGDPQNPTAIVLAAGTPTPPVGTIFTSGPTTALPLGLVARVTRVGRKQTRLIIASVSTVPVTEAVPSLTFSGSLQLAPIPGSTTAVGASAHAASACTEPKLADFKAHLDSVELREALIGLWPPQVKLTMAVRTTESLGVSLAAVGVNCDWTGPELGPYVAAVPVGPVPVPVYATLPFKAGIHINGALQAGTLNIASTTVAHAAAGGDENAASLGEQGSNVWISGVLALSGSAKLSASIGLEAGIGVAKAGNLHVEAGFGPEFDWTSGHDCELNVDLGSLSGGVSVLGHSLNTPSFTPFKLNLWRGCQSGTTGGGGSGGGAGGGGPGGGGGGSKGGHLVLEIGGHPAVAGEAAGGGIGFTWGNQDQDWCGISAKGVLQSNGLPMDSFSFSEDPALECKTAGYSLSGQVTSITFGLSPAAAPGQGVASIHVTPGLIFTEPTGCVYEFGAVFEGTFSFILSVGYPGKLRGVLSKKSTGQNCPSSVSVSSEFDVVNARSEFFTSSVR
jgi:uncharacterized membrane protein YgcG